MVHSYFNGNLHDMLTELPKLVVDQQIHDARRSQIDISFQLAAYSHGAEILLGAKEALSLEGDFSKMELISEVVSCCFICGLM